MSPLVLIQQVAKRKQRLHQAQFLMAKAYRGVSYTSDQKGSSPDQSHPVKMYRGIEYTS